MVSLDSHSGGADFSNFVHVDGSSFPPGASFLMLILDTIVYWFLAFYFDSVIPGEYGQAKPFYFCFMPSYWRSCRVPRVDNQSATPLLGYNEESGNGTSAVVEPVSPELRSKERIRLVFLLPCCSDWTYCSWKLNAQNPWSEERVCEESPLLLQGAR